MMAISSCYMWTGWSQVGKAHSSVVSLPSFCVHPLCLPDVIGWRSTQRCSWMIGEVPFPSPYDRKTVLSVFGCVLFPLHCKAPKLVSVLTVQNCLLLTSRFPGKKGNSWKKGQWGWNWGFTVRALGNIQGKLNSGHVDTCNSENYKYSGGGRIAHSLWRLSGTFLIHFRISWENLRDRMS